MTLSELNTPQLIFLKVNVFVNDGGRNTWTEFDGFEAIYRANKVRFNMSLQREMVAILKSNTPQPK